MTSTISWMDLFKLPLNCLWSIKPFLSFIFDTVSNVKLLCSTSVLNEELLSCNSSYLYHRFNSRVVVKIIRTKGIQVLKDHLLQSEMCSLSRGLNPVPQTWLIIVYLLMSNSYPSRTQHWAVNRDCAIRSMVSSGCQITPPASIFCVSHKDST